MAIQLSRPSPLMPSSAGLPDQTKQPPFWAAGAYYRTTHTHVWTASLDEEFERVMTFYEDVVFCAESVERRPVCVGDGADEPTSIYVVVKTLDPRDQTGTTTLRFGFWPIGESENRDGYQKIDEPLTILALAGAGLAP